MAPQIEIKTRIVERVLEKFVDLEADKIDDAEVPRDEEGNFIIFEQLATPEDPEGTEDILSEEFKQRTKSRQI